MFRLSVFVLALMSAGCVSLDPTYQRPAAPVPATLPGAHGEATAVVSQWQQVMNDARLKGVVTMALNSNRDLQKAIADIDAARAQYGETRSSLFPTVDAELSHTRSRTLASGVATSDEANGTVSSFELDLFGRNQSLSRAARETWLASEFTAQNTRLTLVSELSTAWVTLAADNSNLALAKSTMESAASSLRIVKRQQQVGVAAATDVSEAMAVYQQARASVASYQTQVMQDKNALNLLAGDTVPDTLLPGTLESLSNNAITLIPAGVSSSALLRRPDIKEAEHNLLSANANIGAARANNLAQLRYAEAEKKGLIATYEKTIQSAFKDVADALARRETLSEQLDAQREYVAAEQKTLDVATRSYQAGAGDYLTVLTAQRSLWSAQESLISLQQTDLENRITLWQSLGGGIE